jgi:hypothetical protein
LTIAISEPIASLDERAEMTKPTAFIRITLFLDICLCFILCFHRIVMAQRARSKISLGIDEEIVGTETTDVELAHIVVLE